MEKILISACLIGDNVKYDGKNNYQPKIEQLLEKYELIPFCLEVEGGLKTPRTPAERKGDKVIDQKGKDVTRNYLQGLDLAINIVNYLNIKIAILKDKSPACGVHQIYDGTFSHKTINKSGVLAEALIAKGIKVLSEDEIDTLL
ncbi:MAG: DUF523 domain-containing protein [Bacilli bacterium]|nr:DUF523 domain-containing protein [Bacilli bacterium]